jgi:hypothetical protein
LSESEGKTPIKFVLVPPDKTFDHTTLIPSWRIVFSYEHSNKKWGFSVIAPGHWDQKKVVLYATEWQGLILRHMENP